MPARLAMVTHALSVEPNNSSGDAERLIMRVPRKTHIGYVTRKLLIFSIHIVFSHASSTEPSDWIHSVTSEFCRRKLPWSVKPRPQDYRVELLGRSDESHAPRCVADQNGETVPLVKAGYRLWGAVSTIGVGQLG